MLRMLQQKYGKDFHPLMNMAKIAQDPEADLSLQLNANKELAQYLHPKLRSVDISGSLDTRTTVRLIDLTGDGDDAD